MLYILEGGEVYPVLPCLPWWIPPVNSQVVSSCFLGPSFGYLFRLWPSALVCLKGWGRMKALLGIGVPRSAYLNMLILAPSYHCGHWTLILCSGTLEPRMHRCMACIKVMEILPLTYPHVC